MLKTRRQNRVKNHGGNRSRARFAFADALKHQLGDLNPNAMLPVPRWPAGMTAERGKQFLQEQSLSVLEHGGKIYVSLPR